MISWSKKRQFLILCIPLAIFIFLGYFVWHKFLYKPESCFDGIKNGKEEGVDCGGTCSLLCSVSNLRPIVLWAKSFAITDDVYNLVAYIQNPNINSEVPKALYVFKVYGESNNLIGERKGITSVPKNKRFAVFEGGFKSAGKIKRVDFSFEENLAFYEGKDLPRFQIDTDPLSLSNPPKVTGVITNSDIKNFGNIELVVLIIDPNGNAVSASRTIIDGLKSSESKPFVFTWQKPFPEREEVCEVSSDVFLVLDRSGSMLSISKNPPEPLSSVRQTAVDFIASLRNGDAVGFVSFGSTASDPVDLKLTKNLSLAKDLILKLNVSTSSPNTNIGDGLLKASQEFSLSESGNNKVIILLTDGAPTDPIKVGDADYPAKFSIENAKLAKEQGVSIYSIGLGKDINENLLKDISSGNYFYSPNTEKLSSIYKKISQDICRIKPNIVEIIPNILR